MLSFDFIFPVWIWVLLVLVLLAGAAACVTGFLPMRIVSRTPLKQPARETAREDAPKSKATPLKVSIIALSAPESDPTEFIKSVTEQDYEDYELIIVHESTLKNNETYAERYAWRPAEKELQYGCRDVKFCFYPPGAHAISHKKLALSIGIKAASGDVILTTNTACEIPSRMWLSGIMRHFTQDVDFVLGYARYDYDALPPLGKAQNRFNHIMTSGQWLSAALSGTPVRGDGYNLAYRRDMFFRSKGFADTNDLMNGEDDIFVAANANGKNVEVELSEETVVTPSFGEETAKMFADARDRYRFTASRLPRQPFVRQGVASACQWLMLIAGAAAAVYGFPDIMPLVIVTLIFAAVWFVEALTYKKLAETLGDSRSWGLAPLFLLWRPIDNMMFDLSRRGRKFTNYTLR